ncbi:transposase [Ancylomarina sp. 16SWW S1-10-2]|uniref:transposase n=1 Tax=Ancylomarina sp. 16SWW S1-10-2 TaxID=2499681 RepID=UPI0012ADFE9F|nr:transposase [Ancylomarina sp. 16SWW S1-10-2]MRT94355.1 transposase [Ancylomarina sp. 16SWW S1-10-2]
MSEKFQNKYRIKSTRLQNWDYGSNAAYFVTICTQNREHYFGEITNGIMQLSEIGYIANKYWLEIPVHFLFVELEEFVIMPNHVHGIIIINKSDDGQSNKCIDVETPNLGVSTTTTITNMTTMASKKWKPATLGVIINQYKRICTINARKIHADFVWQPRFYDHIIRNDESLHKIRDYIHNNPSTWKDDKFYK